MRRILSVLGQIAAAKAATLDSNIPTSGLPVGGADPAYTVRIMACVTCLYRFAVKRGSAEQNEG